MAEKSLVVKNQDKTNLLTRAIISLVMGVMFCLSLISSTKTLSIIFGIVFIISGTVMIISTMIKKLSLLAPSGLFGCAFIAFGVFAIFDDLVNVVLSLIPWILIALGVVAILDSFLLMFVRKEKNKTGLFIAELLVGIALLVAGICLKFITNFTKFAGLIFGVSLIVYSIYTFVLLSKEK